jgi:hypothetical protein
MQLHPEIEKQNQSLEEIRCGVLYNAMKNAIEILESQEHASVIKAPLPTEMFTPAYTKESDKIANVVLNESERRANDARAKVSTIFMEPASFASHLVESQERPDAA